MNTSEDLRGESMRLHLGFGFCLAVIAMLAIAACGEETPREAAPSRQSATAAAADEVDWLEVDSPLTPAEWLASRGEAHVRSPGNAKVVKASTDLERAHRLYRESERMIANRAVQLSEMLKAKGIEETPVDILADLAAVPGEVGQTEGFGAVAQMYHNLRASGASRAEALASLKTRYGARQDRNE